MANSNTYGGQFCSPDEWQITTLGSGYIANFLSGGGADKAGATLTNKRIYFSGNTFTFNDKGQLSSIKEQKIVNVRDVTGVGYKQHSPIQYIIYGAIALVLGVLLSELTSLALMLGLVISIAFFAVFFLGRKTLLSVEYAGGNISFDARWLQSNEQDVFIRNIHLAKDNLYSTAAVAQGFVSDFDAADEIPDL